MSEEPSLSEELRRAREARGDALEQVHRRTGIALKILQGLESGDFDVVEPVYARLAIAHYASYLGLDGAAFEERLQREHSSTRPPPVAMRIGPATAAPLPQPSPVADLLRRQPPARLAAAAVAVVVLLAIVLYLLGGEDPPAARVPGPPVSAAPAARPETSTPSPLPATSSASRDRSPDTAVANRRGQPRVADATSVRPGSDRPPSAGIAAHAATPSSSTAGPATSTAAASGASGAIADVAAGPTTEASPAGAATTAAATSHTPLAATATAAGGVPEPTASATDQGAAGDTGAVGTAVAQDTRNPAAGSATNAGGGLILSADAVDSTWVQVQWDGADGIEEIIPKGERRTWRADRFFMVRAGRAHGVHFRFQGQLLGNGRLGDPTKVLRFRATAETVQLLGPDLEPIGAVALIQPDTTEGTGQNRP